MKKGYMRVIKIKTLRDFWEREPKAEPGLKLWYRKITSQSWSNPHEIKAAFPGADPVGNNRIVFDIKNNDYRLIVKFEYGFQQCYVRFVGTHEEYDGIKDANII